MCRPRYRYYLINESSSESQLACFDRSLKLYLSGFFEKKLCFVNVMQDMNECESNPCHPNVLIQSTFSIDIDECALDQDDCDENARCLNNFGNFTCECKFGYMGNGSTGNCSK